MAVPSLCGNVERPTGRSRGEVPESVAVAYLSSGGCPDNYAEALVFPILIGASS